LMSIRTRKLLPRWSWRCGMSATTWQEMIPGQSASSLTARLRISVSMTGSGFLRGNVMLIGCLMRRAPLPWVVPTLKTLLSCQQPIKLRQKLLLFLQVMRPGGLAGIAGVRRAHPPVLSEHERGRERVEIDGLRQRRGFVIRVAGNQERIRNVVIL